MSYTNEMSTKLNELLTKNYDAEAGFKKAAEIVDNPSLERFFKNQAQNRYDFGHKMKEEIKAVGGTPDKGTSFTGDAHRAWMGMKEVFSSNNSDAILEEVIKGESANIETYKEILNDTTLPPTTHKIIENQIASISETLRTSKNLETVLS